MKPEKKESHTVANNLISLLEKGNAHVTLDESLQDVPFDLLDKKPANLPYSLWEIAEHIRIAQFDILEFSRNPEYQSPKWPEGYWPEKNIHFSEKEWENCLHQIKNDRDEFIELLKVNAENLLQPFSHGQGQTLLREALLLADHNSYHTGEIIVVRRLLNNWTK